MIKRSISIHGHQTSLALEAEFWIVIDQAISHKQQSFAAFIRHRDDERIKKNPNQNLASYLRVWALKYANPDLIVQ